MGYLVDTNVLSELVRPVPEPQVVRWFDRTADETLHLSVLTLGEIRKGIETAAPGERRERLRTWLEVDLPGWFEDRILPITIEVADRWGLLVATAGRPVAVLDTLLAATALHHGLRVVTRNEEDFAFPGVEVVNPWVA